ncbi:TPA: hypothetical protein ACKFO9_000979 [Enterococcus faecium]
MEKENLFGMISGRNNEWHTTKDTERFLLLDKKVIRSNGEII